MKIKYAVVEDEIFTRQRLLKTISALRPEMELIFESGKVSETIEFLKTETEIDLLFMDVELTDGNCFQIFDQVSPEVPIIFTTAFDQFALKAFQTYGIGYIVKPYSDEEIAEAIEKYERLRKNPTVGRAPNLSSVYSNLAVESRRHNRRILITSGDNFTYINIGDVSAFEMEEGVIFVYTKDGKRKMTNFQKMQTVLESVPSDEFFQTGRGLIINISTITKVSKQFRGRLTVRYRIADRDCETVVSSTRRDSFLAWLGNS